MELDYDKIADAIIEKEKENGWKEHGYVTVDDVEYYYGYNALEGYEEPCYDIESPRCSPGGYYDLDAWIVNIAISNNVDGRYDDIDIDNKEMSEAFTEAMGGKTEYVTNFFENQ